LSSSCGFIDTSGEFVIPPIYEHVTEFSEGRAHFSAGGRIGFLSHGGREVIRMQFGEADWFHEGLAAVMTWDPVLHAPTTSRSRAYARRQQTKPMGYIDRAGDYAIEPAFIVAGEFAEGLADVEYDIGKWGFVDPAGNIRHVEADCLYSFREGYARFQAEDGRYGFVDTELRVVIPPIYRSVFDFHEGLAWATEDLGQKRSYFLDPDGERVLTFDTYCDEEFSDGLLSVRHGDLWGS
jgi:hypothetical protein